uniref:ORF372 protein n=1 Tax=Mankyua chejuensis TaxID=996148 RepID=H8Y616_9MONI|nr:hypothetical protein MACHC_p033 [Mankyua chejuensis]ADZ47984.1 hypothetical protein [Mankyua chejuensis]AJJ48614.1 ORF372 [Mankyua chejuensis]
MTAPIEGPFDPGAVVQDLEMDSLHTNDNKKQLLTKELFQPIEKQNLKANQKELFPSWRYYLSMFSSFCCLILLSYHVKSTLNLKSFCPSSFFKINSISLGKNTHGLSHEKDKRTANWDVFFRERTNKSLASSKSLSTNPLETQDLFDKATALKIFQADHLKQLVPKRDRRRLRFCLDITFLDFSQIFPSCFSFQGNNVVTIDPHGLITPALINPFSFRSQNLSRNSERFASSLSEVCPDTLREKCSEWLKNGNNERLVETISSKMNKELISSWDTTPISISNAAVQTCFDSVLEGSSALSLYDGPKETFFAREGTSQFNNLDKVITAKSSEDRRDLSSTSERSSQTPPECIYLANRGIAAVTTSSSRYYLQ